MSRTRSNRALWLGIPLLALTAPLMAKATDLLPLGDFGLNAEQVAWTLTSAPRGYRVTSHEHDDEQAVFELTLAGREALWQRLHWPQEGAANARCLGNMLDVFCQVSDEAVSGIAALKAGGSPYFHFDRAEGAKAIHPVKH